MNKNKQILVTGGAGYIGSHCALNLLNKEYNVVIIDNLSTGHKETIDILQNFGTLKFYKADLLNGEKLDAIFKENNIETVIHFAAFSQVGESVKNPNKYFLNNVGGSLSLFNTMIKNDVKKIVFSSTAAIYGEPKYTPIDEIHPKTPINPYGQTKLMVENILDNYNYAHNLKSVRLRYFNVAGANSEGILGEWHEPETHLIPNILKSTFQNSTPFEIYGTDYETKDGTCVRDYINIEDLIEAHILAFEYLNNGGETNFFNLGTNEGNSVKEVFSTCEKITKKQIPLKYMPPRLGDPATLVANNKKAQEILGWKAQKTLFDSISTAYSWENKLQNEILKK